jgi:hypothetical protein
VRRLLRAAKSAAKAPQLILLTDLLTADLEGPGRGWSRSPTARPASRSNRRSWTALDVPDLATDQKVGSMREELWVSSPEPAAGVSTPAGTCPGRLRRHYVIGSADPGQNPPDVRSGSYRVQGRGLSRDTPGPVISRRRR